MNNNHVWHLVARKLSGEATLDELRELEQILLENPELAYQVELYSGYFNAPVNPAQTDEEKLQSWKRTKQKLANAFPGSFEDATDASSERPVVSLTWKLIAAASILLIVAVSMFLWIKPTHEQPVTKTKPLQNELKTMPGTRTKMVLPDGTVVWLNSDSYLTYNRDFGKAKREVTLAGEAYFDVFHNPEVPMVVHAGSVNIWVKGTAFNVRNYPEAEAVETSLIRGLVELTTNEDPGRKIVLKPNEKITIENNTSSPAQEAKDRKESATSIKTSYYQIDRLKENSFSKTIPEIAWVNNQLVFDNEPFSNVILKMERWYNTKFTLQNDELAKKKFSGVFEKETLYEALAALQMLHHFDFTIEGNKVLIQ